MSKRLTKLCESCGLILAVSWAHCPNCGSYVSSKVSSSVSTKSKRPGYKWCTGCRDNRQTRLYVHDGENVYDINCNYCRVCGTKLSTITPGKAPKRPEPYKRRSYNRRPVRYDLRKPILVVAYKSVEERDAKVEDYVVLGKAETYLEFNVLCGRTTYPYLFLAYYIGRKSVDHWEASRYLGHSDFDDDH